MSSSSSSSSLTNCCICLEKMRQPIKTLPCLHSSCSTCIDGLVKMGEKPFKCPLCRAPFDATGLDPNYFTSHLLASSSAAAVSGDFDPNNIICEICEETDAQEYCKDCSMFFCLACKRGHLKPKATVHHQFVSLEDGLKIKDGDSSSTRTTRCHKHPQQEVNSYCTECQEACCAECSVDNHSSHEVVRLATISQRFKGDISTLMDKVKQYDNALSQAINETTDVLVALKKQAKLTEEHVHQVFGKLRLLLDEREAELIGDIEKEAHQKEKELKMQKDGLEFLLKGIRDSVEFSEQLVTEGTGVEIAASHKSVVARFGTLENEKKKTPLSPVTDEVIEFLGGESGVDESRKVLRGVGAIVTKVISAEKSSVVRNGGIAVVVLLKQNYAFDVNLVDQKGNTLVGSVPISGIQVKIDGPSKDVKVGVVEKPGDEGKVSVSFVLDQVGEHEISVVSKGKHLQGSPFKLKVIEKPIYRRDYGLVGDQPIIRFGSGGIGDGQFSNPRGVSYNLRGEIIVVDQGNNRIQVFDKNGRFLFKFGSPGNENGQFSSPNGVTVDNRNQNQIVVADGNNCRIKIFDERGVFLRSFGSNGNGDGQFSTLTGIAFDQTNGNYLVVDCNNHRVQVFDSNGVFIRKFGSRGNGNGQFQSPWGIGLLSNGNIVVSEYGNNRLQIFDSTGTFVRVIPGLSNPCHLFVDSDDNILVADQGGQQVLVFKENGNQVKTIGKGQLSHPHGVCMDDQGRIIVAEQTGNRISIF